MGLMGVQVRTSRRAHAVSDKRLQEEIDMLLEKAVARRSGAPIWMSIFVQLGQKCSQRQRLGYGARRSTLAQPALHVLAHAAVIIAANDLGGQPALAGRSSTPEGEVP